MAANCYRTIKIHFKRGEPDIGKKQNDIVSMYKKNMEHVFGEGACHVLKVRPYGGMKVL